MCGIAGFLCNESMHADNMQQIVGRMTHSLDHRGPDATGIWSDNENHIALGPALETTPPLAKASTPRRRVSDI